LSFKKKILPLRKVITVMERTYFNQTQLHLLKMFSYAKTDEDLQDIKDALCEYFAKKVDEEMDKLWESGEWNEEKNEAVLKEHLRTPYEKQ